MHIIFYYNKITDNLLIPTSNDFLDHGYEFYEFLFWWYGNYFNEKVMKNFNYLCLECMQYIYSYGYIFWCLMYVVYIVLWISNKIL